MYQLTSCRLELDLQVSPIVFKILAGVLQCNVEHYDNFVFYNETLTVSDISKQISFRYKGQSVSQTYETPMYNTH